MYLIVSIWGQYGHLLKSGFVQVFFQGKDRSWFHRYILSQINVFSATNKTPAQKAFSQGHSTNCPRQLSLSTIPPHETQFPASGYFVFHPTHLPSCWQAYQSASTRLMCLSLIGGVPRQRRKKRQLSLRGKAKKVGSRCCSSPLVPGRHCGKENVDKRQLTSKESGLAGRAALVSRWRSRCFAETPFHTRFRSVSRL